MRRGAVRTGWPWHPMVRLGLVRQGCDRFDLVGSAIARLGKRGLGVARSWQASPWLGLVGRGVEMYGAVGPARAGFGRARYATVRLGVDSCGLDRRRNG